MNILADAPKILYAIFLRDIANNFDRYTRQKIEKYY